MVLCSAPKTFQRWMCIHIPVHVMCTFERTHIFSQALLTKYKQNRDMPRATLVSPAGRSNVLARLACFKTFDDTVQTPVKHANYRSVGCLTDHPMPPLSVSQTRLRHKSKMKTKTIQQQHEHQFRHPERKNWKHPLIFIRQSIWLLLCTAI